MKSILHIFSSAFLFSGFIYNLEKLGNKPFFERFRENLEMSFISNLILWYSKITFKSCCQARIKKMLPSSGSDFSSIPGQSVIFFYHFEMEKTALILIYLIIILLT